MFSYVVNLICDGECDDLLISQPRETAEEGEEDAKETAIENGWYLTKDAEWFCPECRYIMESRKK